MQEASLQLQHRQRQLGQDRVLALAAGVVVQEAPARLQRVAVTEHLLRRGRVDAEHAVHGGAPGGGVGMAGIGDAAYLLQGLRNAGQGQDAVVDGETHAAITSKGEGVVRRRCSSGASHQRLAGGDGALRAGEADQHAAIVQHFDRTRLVGLAVAGLCGALEAPRRRRAGNPVRGLRAQAVRQHPAAFAVLVHVQHVAGHVLADHVPRRGRTAAYAAEVQAFGRAQG
ncbi:hypothetical protein G6F24_014305 [Rhizopus arrhizus]|nr:hypothetical protein G6F24_014305 [Rhizopus arrhizus]